MHAGEIREDLHVTGCYRNYFQDHRLLSELFSGPQAAIGTPGGYRNYFQDLRWLSELFSGTQLAIETIFRTTGGFRNNFQESQAALFMPQQEAL
jgi:hypothetical protein